LACLSGPKGKELNEWQSVAISGSR
jgi:hypothetical protein